MYTRCPSCRAEISFNPPANINDLPDGYKHRIKCPSCGVTIGVRIPKVETEAVIYQPQNTFATTSEPVFTANEVDAPAVGEEYVAPKKARTKKPGTMRNLFMMLFSLILIAANVVAYLINNGTIVIPEGFEWANSICNFNGIGGFEALIKDFSGFAAMFTGIADSEEGFVLFLTALISVASMALFVFAGLNFIISFIALLGKKYARGWFFISSFLVAVFAWAIVLIPTIMLGLMAGDVLDAFTELFVEGIVVETFSIPAMLSIEGCFAFAIIIWASLQFIFSLFFLKSLKIKNK